MSNRLYPALDPLFRVYRSDRRAASWRHHRSESMRKPLTPEDGAAILRQASAIEDVANVLFMWRMDGTIKYRSQSYREGSLHGVSASFARVTNISQGEGRFITEMDEQHRREVMVIGVNVAESLSPHQANVAGTQVDLAGRQFKIIGVLATGSPSTLGSAPLPSPRSDCWSRE